MRNRLYFRNFLLILFAGFLSLPATGQNRLSTDTISRIDSLFLEMTAKTPGAVLTIKKSGEIKYHKAFGMADLEHQVANKVETIFEAGSVSKQFTAAALLLLVADKRLTLDDDVRTYIPELPDYGNTIKIRHLLNHTSGLRDWGSVAAIGGWPRTTRVYNQDLARDYIFRQKKLNNIPGAEYIYSNSNYTLLVTIIERISGQSLPEFTKEKMFGPLGMNNTRWRDDFKKLVPGRAIGYARSDDEFLLNMPFENTYGHAALLTTTQDLITWNESWESGKIAGKELYDLRIEQGVLLSGSRIAYAAAVVVDEVNGFTEISHSGATAGYRAWLANYPEADLNVAYLSNYANVSPVSIGNRVAEIYLGKAEKPVQEIKVQMLSPEELQKKQGMYKSAVGHEMLELTAKDDTLYLGKSPLKSISRDTLLRGAVKYIFSGDQLIVVGSSDPELYRKVEKWEPQTSALQEFTGNFLSEEAAGALNISLKEGSLKVEITPANAETLKPSFSDAFYAGSDKLYEFIRNAEGKITGLEISVSRARNVYFEKI